MYFKAWLVAIVYVQQLINHEGYQRELLSQHSSVNNGWQIDYFTSA